MNIQQKPKQTRSLMLLIVSIIMASAGLGSAVLSIIRIITVIKMPEGTADLLLETIPSVVIVLIASVLEISAAVWGILSWKKPQLVKLKIVLGGVISSLYFLGCFILATVEPTFLICGFIGASIPVFYMIGADMQRDRVQ